MADAEDNKPRYCELNANKDQFPCDLTAFNAAFIGVVAALAGGLMVLCLSMRVRSIRLFWLFLGVLFCHLSHDKLLG
jgi:hypothetical protein